MVRTLKNLLLQNQESFMAEFWNIAERLKVYQVHSNDDPGITSDLFMARSDLCPQTFIWEKVEKSFSQNKD